jgi:hypothetical protein
MVRGRIQLYGSRQRKLPSLDRLGEHPEIVQTLL